MLFHGILSYSRYSTVFYVLMCYSTLFYVLLGHIRDDVLQNIEDVTAIIICFRSHSGGYSTED